MSKQFLEMEEILTMEEQTSGIQSTFIRVEVNSKAEAIQKKSQFTNEFNGKSHTAKHHVCNHPSSKCIEEDI